MGLGATARSFVDTSSNSDVLVYDGTEWVGYMSAATKRVRTALYTSWGMGGTTDWASDLQRYHDPPPPSTSWGGFKGSILAGDDPKTDYSRTGTWMTVRPFSHLPSDRWKAVSTEDAWADVVRIWKDYDEPRGLEFRHSVSETLHIGAQANCGDLLLDSCKTEDCPAGANGPTSGPAAQLIWNSLATIHLIHKDYHRALTDVATINSLAVGDMLNTFAPVAPPKDNKWDLLLINLITLGTLGVGAPFFNTMLRHQPFFSQRTSTFDNAKDTALTLIGQSTTIAKDLINDEKGPWTPQAQAAFSNYLAQTIDGWSNTTSRALEELFFGSYEAIEILHNAMSNGKLIEGRCEDPCPEKDDGINELRANIAKFFYGFSIPALWRVSKKYAFIIDAGHACDAGKQLGNYLDDATMDATGACVDGRQYYLAYPAGEARGCYCEFTTGSDSCETICRVNKFSIPPGLSSLGTSSWGGITKDDIVKGSVRTWIQNGRQNSDALPDPTNDGTISNLVDVDVTTPGFMRIPVCSPERAFQSWDTAAAGSSLFYPCDIPPGKNTCEISSFEEQTSDASPSVEDCRTIIRNIEADASTSWTTQVVGQNQREIASHGSCSFGVQATKTDGNVNFVVGGQDVIDIISESIARFGGSGKVGAKGSVNCNGNVKSQPIEWGIY